MKAPSRLSLASTFAGLLAVIGSFASPAVEAGPLPDFTFRGVALHPEDLVYTPTEQLIHPTLIATEGRIENPLGKYYLYYAPHKHIATSLAYADSLEGPWTEFERNPVVEGPSAPEVRWMEEYGRFFLWGHTKNSQTELWTSEDGIHFEHHSVSVKASRIGTRNATYNRVYEYPLEKFGSRYVMLYSGFIEGREIRCVWLAHSKDAVNWTQLETPLVEPIEGEADNLYGPALLRWKGRNFVTYQDMTTWRGGNLKYVEVDDELNAVGAGGERFVLMDPPPGQPLEDRYRGTEFYLEGETLYLFSSGAKDPRLIVWATATVDPDEVGSMSRLLSSPAGGAPVSVKPVPPAREDSGGDDRPDSPGKIEEKPGKMTKAERRAAEAASNREERTSLDEILDGFRLETVYETTFEKPLRLAREDDLTDGGKTFVHEPGEDVDWVLEGPGEVTVKDGRMVFTNSPEGNAVVWNTREFPESFVAEWDLQHHHPQGLAIVFFAANSGGGKSIFEPGLPRRGGNFGNYTRGAIRCYHSSYSATDEEGNPRGSTHLKKDILDEELGAGGKIGAGPSRIDGVTGRSHRLRLAKLGNRIILEVNGVTSFDCTDAGEKGGPPFAGGHFGFRQMRHCLEASYGGLKIQRVQPAPAGSETSAREVESKVISGEDRFPSLAELPRVDDLPDPFRFFGSDRRVRSREDWKERQAEMLAMIQHYSSGPAFPQTHNARLVNEDSGDALGGKAIQVKARLAMGPGHSIEGEFDYLLPRTEGPHSLLLYVCPRKDYEEEMMAWREAVIDRGYGLAWVIPGQFNGYGDHGPVKDAFPEIDGNTMMAWVWGINEVIHYLDRTIAMDRLIITGTSRFGKTAAMAGAVNERIDLTVPVTGGFGVRRFNEKDQKQPASAFEGRCWANDVFPTFAGQLNRLPIDQHFLGAVIAPRGLLGIMGAENGEKNEGHVEAYEALVPVYEWLGAKERLGLYDHSPGGHGIIEGDFDTILDFADRVFEGKHPESGKVFDQVREPGLVGFEWKAPPKPLPSSR